MCAVDLPLPPYRHIPGLNARPEGALFDAVKSDGTQAWFYGIRLFNSGFYWEAHEVLEAVWLNALPNSRERYLVQAVIQLANGLLKEAMGRPNARRRLAGLARKQIVEAFPEGAGQVMGISAAEALAAADNLAAGDAGIRLIVECEL
jgi:hypothetical protein